MKLELEELKRRQLEAEEREAEAKRKAEEFLSKTGSRETIENYDLLQVITKGRTSKVGSSTQRENSKLTK